MEDIQGRLRQAIKARGLKQSWLAAEAGVPKETLSRILTGETENPGVYTLSKIARALGETVGSLLGEAGFDLSADDQGEVRRFVDWANRKLLKAEPAKIDPRLTPNAGVIRIKLAEPSGRVSKRAARIADATVIQHVPRGRAAATPGQAIFMDGDEQLPLREIPTHYAELGATMVRKVEGDSMKEAGITERDLVFVRPTADVREAVGEIVVAEVDGSEYVKVLRIEDGRLMLESANEKYGPMIINEDADRFRLIGIVVGRSGYPAIGTASRTKRIQRDDTRGLTPDDLNSAPE